MNALSVVYNCIHYNNGWKYRTKNKITTKGAFLNKVDFNIKGKNNAIVIGAKARLKNCSITIIGDNCSLLIGGGSTIISNTTFWCQDDNSSIAVGEDFTMEGGEIAATEGETITIGTDCMFSNGIDIRNGDSHSIIDTSTNKRINKALPIIIGDHVWLTARVTILKGSVIPSNSIIGNSAIVGKTLEKENSIYAGIPAKLIKENINWDRFKI